MISPLASLICKVYNHVWTDPFQLVKVGGMILYANDAPYTLRRYAAHHPGSYEMWQVRFEFHTGVWTDDLLMMYQQGRRPESIAPSRGLLKIVKFEGDRTRMERDLIAARMFIPTSSENESGSLTAALTKVLAR